MVCSLRTNFCLFSALFLLTITFGLFAGTYWQMALGEVAFAEKLQVVAGAFNFALNFPIWMIFITQVLDAVDFPYSLPVGDLSKRIPGKSQRLRREEDAV